mgnify:CR=1 FL=1
MNSKADEGYTVLEVLIALVLLFMILTPATYVLTKLLTTADIEERKNANTICISVAERALLNSTIESAENEKSLNGRRYKIKQQVVNLDNGLRLYKITVSRHKRVLSELHHVIASSEEEN